MTLDSGLVFTDQRKNAYNLSEALALDQAYQLGAKAIYFRRFSINDASHTTSLPQIYIYDIDYNENELVDIHRKLWSSGNVPFFYIITNSQLKIFSCTKKAETNAKGQLTVKPLEIISFASNVLNIYYKEKYSAKLIDNGSLWQKDEFAFLLDPKNSPYETLLEGLLNAKKNLTDQAKRLNISKGTVSKLLIMCILVKYLEEKRDKDGNKLFSIDRDFLPKFGSYDQRIEQFTDILRQGHAIDFFNALSDKFSGEVFDFSHIEKEEIQQTQLDFIADIFDAKLKNGHYVIWELYSFNHLPIELISGIYEAFLKEEGKESGTNKGLVYTPPYLVNFLIDECMPLEKAEEYFAEESFKVLDPACGSGIFLVSAFKRMVQWKAILNYKLSGKIEYPDLNTVQRIIQNNIYGVDIEQEATRLTIFSLSIAICEKLSPMQIWKELQFIDLSKKNICTSNFFEYIANVERESFDLVIGNPPFNPPPDVSNKKYFEYLVKKYDIQPSAPINDNNLALLFLDRCMRFPERGKMICLIVPSGAWLYNNNSHEYRQHFIGTHTVNKIIDFTHLSDVLFYGRANIAVCAIIAKNATPTAKNLITHLVVHRAKVAEKRYFFEIDHYDFNYIRHSSALTTSSIWKANLLGGGRLVRLIERISQLETVGDYLEDKRVSDSWYYGEGYIIGHKGAPKEEDIVNKKYKKADWITNNTTVVTDSFTTDGITKIESERNIYFERPREKNKKIFTPPHILIREILGEKKIPIFFSQEYLCFKNQIIGIHAPVDQVEILKDFFNRFKANNSLYRFYLTSISGRAGVSHSSSTLLMSDFLILPFTSAEEDMRLSPMEEMVKYDVSEYLIDLGKSTDSSKLFTKVSTSQLIEYGNTFCQAINPVYESLNQSWQVDSFIENDRFIGYAFCYGKAKKVSIVDWDEDNNQTIYNIIITETRRNVRTTRVLRTYLHIGGYDVLVLIKPNLLRYWLKSVALRDTDETFADLKRAGF